MRRERVCVPVDKVSARGMSRGIWAFLDHAGHFGSMISHPKELQEPLWE